MTVDLDIICEVCGDGETGAPQSLEGICDECAACEVTTLEDALMTPDRT